MELPFKILACLPRFCISLISCLTYGFLSIGARKEKARFFKNVHLIYGLPRHSSFSRNFFKQHLHHIVRCQLETVVAIFAPKRVSVENSQELAEQARSLHAKGRGLIIATGHLGSWELVAKYSGLACERPFHALAKPAKYRWLTKTLDKMRARMNTTVLWTGRPSLLREMMGVLRQNGLLGFVMDQKPDLRRGPIVDFMGRPTEFVAGPASLALKCNSPILAVYCLRQAPWQYRLVSRVIYDGEPETSTTVDELTQCLAHDIEAMIKSYPEQWTWSYKRWRD